jgi:glutaminyl-tRNA synthetase
VQPLLRLQLLRLDGRSAEYLIASGHAYVDSQSAEEMRASRGTLTEGGKDSPFPQRSVDENMDLFKRMQAASSPTARTSCAPRSTWRRRTSTCATRRSTASATPRHHNTGDKWCVYPMYTYAHPIEDALENITHSICTLEFEDQRPFYDWLLERLAEGGLLQRPLPQQIEFSRLNLTYIVLSKRKLIQLVEESTSTAGTTRACRRWSARAAAATRRPVSACLPNASAFRAPIR